MEVRLESIFFDFDGVIADSVNIKTIAFSKMYEPYGPDISKKVVRHHEVNGGLSRYYKFKKYHKDFLNINLNKTQITNLGVKFKNLVVDEIIKCSLIPGAIDFLEKFYKRIPLFVISATPQDELREILYKKELSKYFVASFGSPQKKSQWINYLLKTEKFNPQKIIYVGDTINDYKATLESGVKFIGLNRTSVNNFINAEVYNIINDLFELDLIIERLVKN